VNDNTPLSEVYNILPTYQIWVMPYEDKNGAYALFVVDTICKKVINFLPRVSSLEALKDAKRVTCDFTTYVSNTFPSMQGATHVVTFFNNIPRSAQSTQFMCESGQGLVKLECMHSLATMSRFSHVWTIAAAELYHNGISLVHLPKCVTNTKYEVHMFYRCIVHCVSTPHQHVKTPPESIITTHWRPSTFVGAI
jgi:hypothetical protein